MFPLMRFLERACGRTCRLSCILNAGKNTSSHFSLAVAGSLSRASVPSCEGVYCHDCTPLTVAPPFLAVHRNERYLGELAVGGGKGTHGR